MTSVDIILPYYNGSAFIKEQIESILNSDLEGIRLSIILVNDASSIEETTYVKNLLPAPHVYIENELNLGVIKSVEIGLQASKAPYVMLCDHDDVWLPSKIKRSVQKLQETEENSIAMVYSDLVVAGPNLESIHPSMMVSSGFRSEKVYPAIIYQNIVTGCTIIMNRKLVEFSLPFPGSLPMHDHWLAVCAVFAGKLNLLNEQTILYRQHGNNQIGAKSDNTIDKIINFRKTIDNFQNHLRLKREMAKALSLRLRENQFISESSFVQRIAQALMNRDAIFLLRKRVLRGSILRVFGNILLLTLLKNPHIKIND
jgi:glycosyltransferase involved in cell wall biosynthesis